VVHLADEQRDALLGQGRVHQAALAQRHERKRAHRLGHGHGLGHRRRSRVGHVGGCAVGVGGGLRGQGGGEEDADEGNKLGGGARVKRGSPVGAKAVVVGGEAEQRHLAHLYHSESIGGARTRGRETT
jgi:hypothetical protein